MSPAARRGGIRGRRLALLLAVLHRHGGISTSGQDVFVNVVGGVRISETAADLPAVLAVLSSCAIARWRTTRSISANSAHRRNPPRAVREERLREAAKQGFRRALVPAANAPRRPVRGSR